MNQKMVDKPPERCLSNGIPYSSTGLDFFGPFYIKFGSSRVKRYGCVFTSFSARAIHLEMAVSLDPDAFINAFIRFVSRRGTLQKVWSDKRSNLLGGHPESKHCLQQENHNNIVQAARWQNVDWTFHPLLASHHGRAWGHMIRVARRVLFVLLTSSPLMRDDILQTVLCEGENVINSRSFTKSSDDVNDENALVPNNLLMMDSKASFPWGMFSKEADVYRHHWRCVFWRRWIKEYFPLLQSRGNW